MCWEFFSHNTQIPVSVTHAKFVWIHNAVTVRQCSLHVQMYCSLKCITVSGAGTNLKVGATDPAPSAGNFFLVVPLHILALKAQLVVLVSAFLVVSTLWSVSCLLFFYSRCHPVARAPYPAICKSGGTRAPRSSSTGGGKSGFSPPGVPLAPPKDLTGSGEAKV